MLYVKRGRLVISQLLHMHVFLRTDLSRASLEPPYTGPYEVLSRNDKTFKILVKNKTVVVSIDRLKPAYILDDSEYQAEPPMFSKKSTGSKYLNIQLEYLLCKHPPTRHCHQCNGTVRHSEQATVNRGL
ncbi:hypothetical protein B566_EDAN014940 [Ephemera danica]|nr:hypothetical protein B566_EDAN014940 [Ephemera danica]